MKTDHVSMFIVLDVKLKIPSRHELAIGTVTTLPRQPSHIQEECAIFLGQISMLIIHGRTVQT
jgi:hypothetical protein